MAVLAVVATACQGPTSILDPSGSGARIVVGLWWLLLWVSIGVVGVVVVMLVYSLRRRQAEESPDLPQDVPAWGDRFVVWSGFVIPTVILVWVFGVSLGDLNEIADIGGDARLSVEVEGRMWWWEARYPNGAVTANEIHIPVGEPVELVLTTGDVIHSFWVPSLHPKKDMIPGRENTLTLVADEPGRYRGVCAEFCGLQHANMALFVVADPDFDSWVEDQAAEAPAPSGSAVQGRDVFLESTCIACHTIRGTPAQATRGPDLTHLASRETLFADRVDNMRANLSRIITDPQSVKPGVAMPPTALDGNDLDDLLDYLESLE